MQRIPYSYGLSDEAESDIYESYQWYEKQKIGLGKKFLNALDAAKLAIVQNPKTYRFRYMKKVRAYLVPTFSYLILYIVEEKNINVIAVFNTNQHPKNGKRG